MVCTNNLREIPRLHKEASNNLQPGNGGHGSLSGERTIGVNLRALDFSTAHLTLFFLFEWQVLIRELRNMAVKMEPVGLVSRQVENACEFLLVHISFLGDHPHWADDFFREIQDIYFEGLLASNLLEKKPRQVVCPSNFESGRCGRKITVNAQDLNLVITCTRCHTPWTTYELMSAFIEANEIDNGLLDADGIAAFVELSPGHVRRLARKWKVPKDGMRYDFLDFLAKLSQERDQDEKKKNL